MIEICSTSNISEIENLLSKDFMQNPYLYVDVNTYGFQGENIHTYLIRESNKIQLIIYQYYNSLQLWINRDIKFTESLLKEIAQFVIANKPVMISGLTSLITDLKTYLPFYKQTDGYLFEYQNDFKLDLTNLPSFKLAHTQQDFEHLAAFITSDSDIGSHYTVTQLTKQFLERHQKYNCQNIFLEEDGRVIAHVGTYACYGDLVVIGGLLVAPNQRGKGVARKLMTFLSYQCVQCFYQKPVFYCYIPSLFKFYESCGYKKSYNCSKLELIGDKNA